MTSTPVHMTTRTTVLGNAVADFANRFPVAPTPAFRKPRTAKHEPRLTAEAFDPALVSKTLSPRIAAPISGVDLTKPAMPPKPEPTVEAYSWTPEVDARTTKYVMYALEAEFEGEHKAARVWADIARACITTRSAFVLRA